MAKDIIVKKLDHDDDNLFERQSFEVVSDRLYVLADPSYSLMTIIDGVFNKTYGEGKHLLVEQKFSLFKKKNPVDVQVIFVARERKIKTLWGMSSPFDFKDTKTGEIIKVGANGEAEVYIDDPQPFFNKLVSNKTKYTASELSTFVREKLALELGTIIYNVITNNKITFYEFESKIKEISSLVLNEVKNMFLNDYGITFHSFTLNQIFVSDDDKARIKRAEEKAAYKLEQEELERKQKQEELEKEEKERKLKEELKRDAKEIAAELERLDDKAWERQLILKQLEKEDYNKYLDVVQIIKVAESNAKALASNVNNSNNKNHKPHNNNNQKSKICSVCGEVIPADGRFCPKCGKVVPGIKIQCKHCGTEIDSGLNFCSHCGKKID